jgi:hypothetical protein
MKVPDKYEPKTLMNSARFDRAVTKLLAVPADEVQSKTKKHKRHKKKSKTGKSGPSRDSGGEP